ncbi:M20/M25/M40 family metallo-hydrolase [Solirubrobacter phytolaccae]|uniref:M20/M25/M40 family metallo-hydrolase n=1 Tax=Solirubrobacter phytolaccae TaxID=1404360 RepID=A0A9X3N6J1_9ACTN|nr:M20/M25/M40 family metallo-hydrolase [Solirubrobacter phytolaccae]MDA0179355.1 M20/M25/M40 family metallo-hydrolase [Solirubrobacter phytolaccae]
MTVADLTAALVAIDSVNPALVPGGAGEREIAAFLTRWAEDNGLDAQVFERTPGRPSVVITARGTGGGRTLLLCGHTDTVGVDDMDVPHDPRRDGDRLHGRGACDMKGGLAAALIAAREAGNSGLAGDVVVACVADEEHASLGMQEVLEHVRADAAVVTEPTREEIIVAHKGFVWAEIVVEGTAAHGSRPERGVDAIVHAGAVLTALGALDAELVAREPHPVLGRGSVHAGTITGGIEASSYPGRCTITVERRTLPGESEATFAAELEAVIAQAARVQPGLRASFTTGLVREAFAIATDHELVRLTQDHATRELGAAPPLTGAPYWTDAAFIAAAGIPALLFGPTGEGEHAVEEWVSVASVEAVTRTLTALATSFCR